MRLNVITSMLIIMMVTAAMGGATLAWFTHSGDNTSGFTAGTIIVGQPVASGEQSWAPGECRTIQWTTSNTGSKKAYIRVRPEVKGTFPIYIASHVTAGTETAWLGVPGTDPRFRTIPSGPGWNQYFEFPLGRYTQENPLEIKILAGSTWMDIGFARIWNDEQKLYISYYLKSGYPTDEINVYAGLTAPTNHSPGSLGWSYYFNPRVTAFNFSTAYIYNQQDGQASISIAELLEIEISGITWTLSGASTGQWVEGDDGWWYYATPAGLTEVAPGEVITLSFLFCLDENFNQAVSFYLLAEAVQSSHGAVYYVWPDSPRPALNPSLASLKQAARNSATVGETINYTITVTNDGNVGLTSITVADPMVGINATIASLAPGASETFTGSYTVVMADLPGPLVNMATASAVYNGENVSASATATVTLTAPLVLFNNLLDGDYVSINGVLFQKIGENLVLLRAPAGNADWSNAITQGTNYYHGFQVFAVSSRLLTSSEADNLRQQHRSSILAIGTDWWTGTEHNRHNGRYVTADGGAASGPKSNLYGVRPSLFLKPGIIVTGGSGTSVNPYILAVSD